jgi:hypothetical protein
MYGTTCTSTKEDWRSLLIACGRVAVLMSTVCNPFIPAYHTPPERGGSYNIGPHSDGLTFGLDKRKSLKKNKELMLSLQRREWYQWIGLG